MRPTSVLPILFLFAGLSTNVIAQRASQTAGTGNGNNNNNNDNTNIGDGAPPALSTATQQPPAQSSSAVQSNAPATVTNTRNGNQATTAAPPNSQITDNAPSRTSNSIVLITGSASAPDGDAPDLSTATMKPTTVIISGKPVVTSIGDGDPPKLPPGAGGIPDYPPAAVPDTHNAPFMQRSNLPEGTVFIAVGGALGLVGLIAIAWRMIVAWQLRRSIRRANMSEHMSDMKGLLGRHNAPGTSGGNNKSFYSAGAGSSLSLDHLGGSRTGQTPNSSLFFSPTANTGPSPGMNRSSAYLPAGYYAPAGSPGPMGSRDSLPRRPVTGSTLLANSTPPASPLLSPQPRRSPGHHHGASASSRNSLGVPGTQGGRTPSMYLEDMLDTPGVQEESTHETRRHSRRKSGNQYGGYNRGGR